MDRRSEKEEARIFAILQAIHKGSDVDQVMNHVQEIETDQFGQETEDRVFRILSELHYIDSLALTGKWSELDRQGRDIALRLTNPYSGRDQIVFVQVKSSYERIAEFRQTIQRKFSLREHEIDGFLRQEKLILVNGRAKESELVTAFEDQLHAVLQHHAAQDQLRRDR